MFKHTIRLMHDREPLTSRLDKADSDSDIEINVQSMDLQAAWEELLTRMPTDLYEALRRAMPT